MKNCPSCNATVPEGAKYCPQCGAAVDESAKKPAEGKGSKSTAVRDTAIVVGVLAVVAAGYFLLKEPAPKPEPPVQQQSRAQVGGEGHPPIEGMGGSTAFLDNAPKDYATLVQMGNQYMDEQNFPVAAELYKRALAIDSNSLDVRTDYGACLHGMGLDERAGEEFRRVLAGKPDHTVATFNLGIVHMDLNNTDSAKFYFERYLALEPNGPVAPNARQLIQQLSGK